MAPQGEPCAYSRVCVFEIEFFENIAEIVGRLEPALPSARPAARQRGASWLEKYQLRTAQARTRAFRCCI